MAELFPNTSLSHYRIVSRIGAGGMGEVYLALDTKLDRRVALKILPAELAGNQDRMRRFTQEAKAAAALNHPNIAHIYEVGQSDNVNYIAMEFIDGVALREKIHQERGTSSGDAVLAVEEGHVISGQVWEVGFPSGEARRLTNTFTRYGEISKTADGRAITLVESETRSSVWVSSNTDPNASKQILPASGDIRGIAWTPDGRIVYVSDQSGESEIWSMNADGSDARQLTNDRVLKSDPVVSPDGRYIVYQSVDFQLFRIEMSGGNPVQLTSGVDNSEADISLDSKWVLFTTYADGRANVIRMPIGGGEPQRLYDGFAGPPRYSPDGKYFACSVPDQKTQRSNRLAIFPADGGEPVKILELPVSRFDNLVWTPDGKGIAYMVTQGERTNMWVQPLDGGKPKQITNFDQPAIGQAAYSRDGKQIAIIRGETTSNAVLITGFR